MMTKENIRLSVVLPHKVLPETEVAKVMLPAQKGVITILPDRAPTTLLLENGVMSVLNADNTVAKQYFVKGGVANVAADKCTVTTEKMIDFADINTARVQVLKHEHQKDLDALNATLSQGEAGQSDSDIEFYQYIFKYLEQVA